MVEFVVSSSNLAYRTIGLSVLSFDLPIPPVFHPCLKMCQLTNHRSIVSHIYATNLVVVRRGVLRRRQDPPRDRLSHGRSRVSASEICEQPIPCLDQCVYNIDLGTHLPDESQTDDTSLACANARWSPANVTHTLSPHSSEALRKRPFWFGRIQVGFRSPPVRTLGLYNTGDWNQIVSECSRESQHRWKQRFQRSVNIHHIQSRIASYARCFRPPAVHGI